MKIMMKTVKTMMKIMTISKLMFKIFFSCSNIQINMSDWNVLYDSIYEKLDDETKQIISNGFNYNISTEELLNKNNVFPWEFWSNTRLKEDIDIIYYNWLEAIDCPFQYPEKDIYSYAGVHNNLNGLCMWICKHQDKNYINELILNSQDIANKITKSYFESMQEILYKEFTNRCKSNIEDNMDDNSEYWNRSIENIDKMINILKVAKEYAGKMKK